MVGEERVKIERVMKRLWDVVREGIKLFCVFFFFSSRRRHTRYWRDWSSDVCSSDLGAKRFS